MIISKQDCYTLLIELNKQGVDIKEQVQELQRNIKVPKTILSFINKNRALAVTDFYNKLRKDTNKRKNKLYINIMKELEEDINEILITLTSLTTHIFIFGKNLEGSQRKLFFNSVKLKNIQEAINSFLNNNDGTPAINILRQIKNDIKILEQDLK